MQAFEKSVVLLSAVSGRQNCKIESDTARARTVKITLSIVHLVVSAGSIVARRIATENVAKIGRRE